ncbi:MAG: DUF308 domain-containing protein [Bacteroidales bacterium]|nr:DUF308 domain-containing protein [Bacteroidales bacterium]MDT8431388.1 DUF308 domain-containing protein [Bacteroidales bacterium]
MDTRIIVKTNPWVLVLQGVIMLAAGIFVLSDPEVTLVALTRLLGIIMLIAAGFLLFSSTYKREKTNQLLFIEGVINAGLGLVFTLFPALLANVFIVLLGVIAFLSGLINLWMLIRDRARITSAPFLRNSLVLLFGILLLVNPGQGREAVAVIIGVFAIIFGITSFYGVYKLWWSKE